MRKKIKQIIRSLLAFTIACVCLACSACNGTAQSGDDIVYTATLGDNNALLTNPGMGWNFCFYSNRVEAFGNDLKANDLLDEFPCDIVFFRLGWKYFQPKKDVYDWSLVDDVVEKWVSAGKRVAFCWEICCPNTMDGQSCPLWLRDECGAEGVEYNLYDECIARGMTASESFNRPTWVPYYDDEVFLQYFTEFLNEAAKKYDGKDWVEFIEIGSMGTWGEGNTHFSWPAKIYPETIPTHLNMWRDAFPNTTVLVNDDLINGKPAAIELSKTLGLGCVDDGVQVPEAGMINGRYANGDVFDEFWGSSVCSIEHHPGTVATDVYYDSLWMSHASYSRLHMNPYSMKSADNGEWVDKMTKRMGYRLTVGKAEFAKIEAGKKSKAIIAIKNTGVAPCYDGGFPMIIFKDANGKEIVRATSDFNVKNLEVYEDFATADYTDIEITFSLPTELVSGNYSVYFSVVDESGNAKYNLPLNNGEEKQYKIAVVQV